MIFLPFATDFANLTSFFRLIAYYFRLGLRCVLPFGISYTVAQIAYMTAYAFLIAPTVIG